MSEKANKKLLGYNYPGNIRELKALIELASVLSDGEDIEVGNINFPSSDILSDLTIEDKSLKEYNNVIIKHFGSSYQGANVEYSIENVPLGTGGAMLLASQGLSESFLVINGDTFIDIDLGKMLNFHGEVKSDWTMALIQSSNSVRYMGVDILDDGRVSSIKSNTNLANGGVYLIDPNAVERHKEAQNKKISLEDDLLPQLILNNGSLYGFESFGSFIDIGIPEDYERAVNILNSGI